MVRFLLRVALVALALVYAFPAVSGIKFSGDPIGALVTSLVFNVTYFGLEWLLAVVAIGVNIGTLGLGVILTSGLKFLAGLIAPSIALFGTSYVMPQFLQVSHYFPGAVVAGLVLGGILWATAAAGKKR